MVCFTPTTARLGAVARMTRILLPAHEPSEEEENVVNAAEHELETAALRDRLSRLSEASLRINESLDLDTVLQEVVDSARALTGSAYGAITTLDDSGLPKDFVTSGMSPEARRALENYLPEGLLVYRYLSTLREPLRLDNYGEHIALLGLSDFLPISASSFLTAPIRHGGRAEGNIYLAKSEPGDEFTQEDEETLVMFASHAALVIANARRHRSEQQARTNLETLIDTSPVGVAVFDAKTGAPVSFNRAAAGADPRGPDLPARRREGDFPGGVPGGAGPEHRRDGAGRGGGHPGARRQVHHHPD